MKKADLHVHSIYSEHPSEWFLQRIGASESYTDPEFIYSEAKRRGMDFVTITDHNKIDGALLLNEKYPNDTFTGVESTAYFPEDRCKIHVLIYGLNEKQYHMIQKIRKDIYLLRDFLKEENLAHSVAHATYSVNGKLNLSHLEKLILLFDVFEGINGGRNKTNNLSWIHVLNSLKPQHLEELRKKYRIEPFSDTPWIKGFTAGSDDHAGLFSGKTYTALETDSVNNFLNELKNKNGKPFGRHNDYQSFAFTIYKIAYEYSKTKSKEFTNSLLSQITGFIFENKNISWKNRLKLKKSRRDTGFRKSIANLVDVIQRDKEFNTENRIKITYSNLADVVDEFFKGIVKSIEDDLGNGDFINVVQTISSSLPGIFIAVPFFSTLFHMNKNRKLLEETQKRFNCKIEKKEKSVLWFSDTVNDLNGVSITVKKIRDTAAKRGKNVRIVSCLEEGNDWDNFLNLPIIHELPLPYYEKLKIRIPSFLKSLELILQHEPDEIVISTPGPIGILGLLVSKLLNIKSIGVYHTDFGMQIDAIKEDESLTAVVDLYINWFYQQCSEVRVPTNAYIDILSSRGIDESKLKLFRRGIDTEMFFPVSEAKTYLKKRYGLNEGKYFLYAGRISKDKNIDVIISAFRKLYEEDDSIYLFIVGDGPYLQELKDRNSDNSNIIFTGKIDRRHLTNYYSGCDLFLFPSTTDTFGMVILEAQACGLPVLVTDCGGPKEIVRNGETGYIIPVLDSEHWRLKMSELAALMDRDRSSYEKMRQNGIDFVRKSVTWDSLLDDFLSVGKTENIEN